MCGLGDEMRIGRTFPIFVYFNAKTDPVTEVLGHAKTETETEFKIPQPPNTNWHLICEIHLRNYPTFFHRLQTQGSDRSLF